MRSGLFVCLFLLSTAWAAAAQELTTLPLNDMEAFEPAADNWQIAGAVSSDRTRSHHLEAEAGTGILVNLPTEGQRDNLLTRLQHEDLVLELDVLVPQGSNSGIYLQNSYEVQLLDSWGERHPTYGDMAGIYHRWRAGAPEGERGYQGHAPRVNVSRAPGLWQHLRIVFQAPRFDADGDKVENARMLQVIHNGVVVHENVELTGPTRGGAPEEPGPAALKIQGDHGPVAFRNIRYRTYEGEGIEEAVRSERGNPLEVEVGSEPYVVQSFLHHPSGEEKTFTGLPVVINGFSVGEPGGINYAVNGDDGGLLYVWKGPFINTAAMWRGRGADQVAEPMGSVIRLSGGRPIARLDDADAAWPTSIEDVQFEGYDRTEAGRPIFRYRMGDVQIRDRFAPEQQGRTLTRRLTVSGDDGDGLWLRMAAGEDIERLPDGAYSVDNRTYLVQPADLRGEEPVVRQQGGREELVVPVSTSGEAATLQYTLIW